MIAEIRVPDFGEINGMTITKWVKETGDIVEKDEIIAEVDSDKAYITINAPESGILEVLVDCGDVQNGQLIARVNTAEYVNSKIKNNISPNDIIGR
jgi:2-oxoglutarate dehydrogenase E2 component (dihydrolipoamide succinyltransferase)